jgi:hypothetical protein
MRELGPNARRLLALDATHGGPTEHEGARVRRAVLGEIAAVAVVGGLAATARKTTTAGPNTAAGAAASSGLLLKLGVTLVTGIALGTGATAYFRGPLAPTRMTTAGVWPAASTAVATTSGAGPVRESDTAAGPESAMPPPAPVQPGRAASPSAPAAERRIGALGRGPHGAASLTLPSRPAPDDSASPGNHPVSDTMASELVLLRDARLSLRQGDAARALSILGEHAERFPSATLGEERDALRITALCALGRTDEVVASKAVFARRYPASPLGPAALQECPR